MAQKKKKKKKNNECKGCKDDGIYQNLWRIHL